MFSRLTILLFIFFTVAALLHDVMPTPSRDPQAASVAAADAKTFVNISESGARSGEK